MFVLGKLSLIVTVICLGAACLLGQPRNKEMVCHIGEIGIPATLEPVTATKPVELRLGQFIFDSLVVQHSQGDYGLSLAKDIDIAPDGLAYTFILHKNLCWSDGTPLTTKDIEFTLSVLLNKETDNYRATLAKYIADVICINPQAITISLSRPFYSPLALFTFKILPKHKLDTPYLKRQHPFTQQPLGCGPFVVAKWDDTTLTLVPNPYFGQRNKPLLDKIVVHFYSDKSLALQDFRQKKLHLVTEIGTKDRAVLGKPGDGWELCQYRNAAVQFIAVNHRPESRYHPLFSDYRFRRALLQAIDRQTILDQVFGTGDGKQHGHEVVSGPFPKNSWAYNDKIKPHPYNFAYAEQLLKEILTRQGYQKEDKVWTKPPEGRLELTLKYLAGDAETASACAQIAAAWNSLGLLVSLDEQPAAKFYQALTQTHRFDLAYTQYPLDNTLDLFPLFDPAGIGPGQSNFSGYVDSKLAEQFLELHTTLNPWAVQAAYYKIHQTLHEDVVHFFMWQIAIDAAYQLSLKNVKWHPRYLIHFPEKWKIIEKS